MNVPKIILLIGNNPHWLDATAAMLEQSKHIVLFALNGMEGFLVAQCDLPDLVICEIDLPDMSGIDLCRLIRNDNELCEVPLILVNESQEDIDQITEKLHEDVNDDLTVCCNLGLPAAENKWLSVRKQSEAYLELSYQILFFRQHRLTEIIKDTAGLIKALNSEYRLNSFTIKTNQETEANLDKRIEVGMNIIDGLTCLLNEQSNSLMNLVRVMEVEEVNTSYNSPNDGGSYKDETYNGESYNDETYIDESFTDDCYYDDASYCDDKNNYESTDFLRPNMVNA